MTQHPLGTPVTNTFSLEVDKILPRVPHKEHVDWRVSRLREFIDQRHGHLACVLTDACRRLDLGISPEHAARMFRDTYGIGIRLYMKRSRLHAAAKQLESTSLAIKEISADLGYKSPADLYRQFKQIFHVTPKQFRNLRRMGESIYRVHHMVRAAKDEELCTA